LKNNRRQSKSNNNIGACLTGPYNNDIMKQINN